MMTSPAGESSWIDFVDQHRRNAFDLDTRVALVEHFRRAVSAEPGSLKIWIAYCEYFWSLYTDCQPGTESSWPAEELELGRQVFSLDAALNLWQEGYEAVQYRLSDSHELWDRWISLEMELLSQTRTEQGVRRITQLFKNRLRVPHATWDNTSTNYSTFLSQYNQAAYELEMQDVIKTSKEAKKIYEARDAWEMKLNMAAKAEDPEPALKQIMLEYLAWEILETKKPKKEGVVGFQICLGLFSRALTGLFASDEDCWLNFLVLISTTHSDLKAGRHKLPAVASIVPNLLDVHQRAVRHVPWSGTIWARYILSAEEAGLSFSDIERIKHAATSSPHLDRDGMMAVLEMYSAWCGYLKRTAMNPHATEESIDLAEVGLPAALEDVKHWGRRRYGDAYQGDPSFRLEKILIQFLMEKKENVEAARAVWSELSGIELHANSYDFWLHWYLWEMVVFAAAKSKMRSPTPSTLNQSLRVPTFATLVFHRALKVKTIDWPERIMEVFLQHCNDYELPETLRGALDTVYKTRKGVAKRREREQAQAARAQAQAYAQAEASAAAARPNASMAEADNQQQAESVEKEADAAEPAGAKRKRELSADDDEAKKRAKSAADDAHPHRDREHSLVFLTNLPPDITQTKIKRFFNEYGNVKNIDLQTPEDSPPVALVEFSRAAEAETALIREGKKIDGVAVSVTSANDCTLYVTNYPAEADKDYIRKLFSDFGPIHSIRFPNLEVNSKRRFCYVTYRDSASARKAIEKLDGQKLGDALYKIQVKMSDPNLKRHRSGALAEQRQLHLLNVHPDIKEQEVRDMFGKIGTVEAVRIVRGSTGYGVRHVYVDMQTKEMAEEAIQKLDKTSFRGRILTVELSKFMYKKGPAEGGEEGGAETKTEGSGAGSPAGSKTEGEKGAKDTKEKAPAVQADKKPASAGLMAPPPNIRRPVLGGAGRKRGGLGFVASKKTAAPGSTTNGEAKSNGAAETTKKSNDDFRKLLLQGNAPAEKKEE